MRATASEKLEIIRLVEGSELSVSRTLAELDVPRSTFYHWYQAYQEGGYEALEPKESQRQCFWNRIPEGEREKVVEEALARPELSPREALRQAILLRAAATLRPCPRLPASLHARDRLDALDSLLFRDDLLSQGT